jgi:cyclohexanecarboxylate-CoA ligase
MSIVATWHAPQRFPEAEALTQSTPALLEAVLATDPHRVQVIDEEHQLSGTDLATAVAGIQQWLRGAGVHRGDSVCVQLPNWWEAVVTAHAIWGLGAVLCPIPVNYRVTEFAVVLRSTPIAAIIVPGSYRQFDHFDMVTAAQQASGTAVPTLVVRPAGRSLPYLGLESTALPELAAGLDDICLLMFTSGTTGRPKGVLHSHRSLLADAVSIAELFAMKEVRVFMPSPVAHVTGLVYGVLMPLVMGGDCVLQHRWQPEHAVDLIERHRCQVCVGATPFLKGLAEEYIRRRQQSALTAFICGGADVPPALVRRAQRAMRTTVVRAYGLTEMPTVTCGGPMDPDSTRSETDGRLTGSSAARLRIPLDNGVGELEVCGPEMFLGYLAEADTARAFTEDGWFRTGDLARLTSTNAVTIVGRAKDIVVRGGENISTKEVEDYLIEHPLIDDVAIVGVPDDVLGEKACAMVVAAGVAPTLAVLSGLLKEHSIAKHKFPEYLLIVDSLPRTPSGKIQKFRLRDDAVRLLGAGTGEAR